MSATSEIFRILTEKCGVDASTAHTWVSEFEAEVDDLIKAGKDPLKEIQAAFKDVMRRYRQ